MIADNLLNPRDAFAEGREIAFRSGGKDLHQGSTADFARRVGRHARQAGESLPFGLAVRALDALVQYEKDPPVGRKTDARHGRRDFAASPNTGVDDKAAGFEQCRADAGARAAIEQARIASRIQRKPGQTTKRRRNCDGELGSGPKARMRGDRVRDDQLFGHIEVKTLGNAERQTRAPLALLARRFEAQGFAKLNAGLERGDGEADRAKFSAEVAVEIEKAQMQARRSRDPNAFQLRLTPIRSPGCRPARHDRNIAKLRRVCQARDTELLPHVRHFHALAPGRFEAQAGRARDEVDVVAGGELLDSRAATRTARFEDRCAMIELILTVCALSAPGQCQEQRLQFLSQGSLMQCMMQAPPYIAAWSGEHPGTRVTRWRCAYPGAGGQKT